MTATRSPPIVCRPTARRRRHSSPITSSAVAASFLLTVLLRGRGEGGVAAQSAGDDDSGGSGDGNGGASYPDCDGDVTLVGDALCDFDLNVAACGFDGGDCCECTCVHTDGQACGTGGAGYFCLDPDAPQDCGPTESPTPSPSTLEISSAPSSETSTTYPGCGGYLPHMGDGFCDEDLNTAACDFDGGDCCPCTCGGGTSTETDNLEHACGNSGDGFDCRDPDVPADCEATPSPADSFGYPDCTGYIYDWQDSYCDYDLNNEECGWDGGDCCPCTCREYSSWSDTCGYFGYECLDPEAPTTCSTDSPTPSPAAGTDYPECEGIIIFIGDSYCDSYNNNEECDWDGGDCCPCTCEDSGYYSSCGSSFDCLDPDVGTDCTPSPASSYVSDSYPGCYTYAPSIGDGYCDSSNNNEDCDWDGGDCCPCTCDDSDTFNPCGAGGYSCLDPYADTSCSTSYDSVYGGLTSDTSCPMSGDGKCDSSDNTATCDYDGGDCCECDCISGAYDCGTNGYECADPDSSCTASTSITSGQIVGGFSLLAVGFCCFGGVVFAVCGKVHGKCRAARDEQGPEHASGAVPATTGARPPEPENAANPSG